MFEKQFNFVHGVGTDYSVLLRHCIAPNETKDIR